MGAHITRRTLVGGAILSGVAALAGCGGDSRSGTGALNLWGAIPGDTGPEALVKAFTDNNPEMSVTYTRYLNDDAGNLKLDTGLTGGVPIDLFFQ